MITVGNHFIIMYTQTNISSGTRSGKMYRNDIAGTYTIKNIWEQQSVCDENNLRRWIF